MCPLLVDEYHGYALLAEVPRGRTLESKIAPLLTDTHHRPCPRMRTTVAPCLLKPLTSYTVEIEGDDIARLGAVEDVVPVSGQVNTIVQGIGKSYVFL
jgi:hypothetical protein